MLLMAFLQCLLIQILDEKDFESKAFLAFPSLSEKIAMETFLMNLIVGPDGVQLIQFISSLIGGNKTHVFVLFVCLIFPSVFHENSRKNIRQKSQLVSS